MGSSEHLRQVARLMERECLALRIRRLNRRVTRIYDDALRPHGVSTAHLNILVALALADSARPTDIARELDLEKSTLSRNLARMAERGWVEVAPSASGSAQQLALLPPGRRVVEQTLPAWRAAQRRAKAEIHADLAAALRQPGDARVAGLTR